MNLVNIDEVSDNINSEVDQLREAVNYYIECWELVKSAEIRYELELKIKHTKKKIRSLSGDNHEY